MRSSGTRHCTNLASRHQKKDSCTLRMAPDQPASLLVQITSLNGRTWCQKLTWFDPAWCSTCKRSASSPPIVESTRHFSYFLSRVRSDQSSTSSHGRSFPLRRSSWSTSALRNCGTTGTPQNSIPSILLADRTSLRPNRRAKPRSVVLRHVSDCRFPPPAERPGGHPYLSRAHVASQPHPAHRSSHSLGALPLLTLDAPAWRRTAGRSAP
ncbi:hypothetical protein EXIGLDRAFT_369386 [Exidia glandulosa HHB12029]|uniref:Uncharacterized protein n=1 Tax=Exidia glandulosa HHB12029 TaxID=1314781 RepID=A0A165C2U9_EXIGL|nr:hypothetical protein EXIGLDRAFT_369386 [Exidia glandulosa HHB12029]